MTKGLTQGVNGRGVGSFWIGRGAEGEGRGGEGRGRRKKSGEKVGRKGGVGAFNLLRGYVLYLAERGLGGGQETGVWEAEG